MTTEVIGWLQENKNWVFEGIGVFAIGLLIELLRRRYKQASPPAPSSSPKIENHVHVGTISQSVGGNADTKIGVNQAPPINPKSPTRILFIDDDTRFAVVKILKNAGWPHVKILRDISSLEQPDLTEAHILFVDIQGVGKALRFTDEGLGLAAAIKKKYPEKHLIIYSSQTSGERFHEGFRLADSSIAKNAQPYEFIKLVEDFAAKTNAP